MEKVLAAVKVGTQHTQIREFSLPEIRDDAGLLRVDVSGVCGTDVSTYNAPLLQGPFIMGHEIVGRIAKLGKTAALNWGLKEGDRVAIESYRGCGHCESCISGYMGHCPSERARNEQSAPPGSEALPDFQPSRGGGFSQYLYLWPTTRFHKVPDHVPDKLAALAIPFGNGWQWAYMEANAGPGKRILIAGPGQQGLACVVASRQAGADQIIVSGLSCDAKRLEVARHLGADHTIDVQTEDLRERVLSLTGGRGVDVAIDVAAGTAETILPLIDSLRPRGVLVAIAVKGSLPNFPLQAIARKGLTVKGVVGHSYRAVELALQTIASGKYPLEEVATHQFGLKDVDAAIRAIARENSADAIHAIVAAWK